MIMRISENELNLDLNMLEESNKKKTIAKDTVDCKRRIEIDYQYAVSIHKQKLWKHQFECRTLNAEKLSKL